VRARRLAVPVAIACLVAGVLTGCARTAPELTGAVATRLQADVLAVSEASATGDLGAARAALGTLTSHVDAARGAGDLSPARQARIEAAAVLVSADLTDLEQQAAAAAAATAQAAAARAAAATLAADKAAADQAAADRAAAEKNAAKDPAPGGGPGKDKRK